MIGIVGPVDSVALVVQRAALGEFADELVVRTYRHASEAPELACELDPSCTVLLFTGQVPYMLGGFELTRAEPQFISHSGADLYRCVARVLRERGGVMPVVSVDSIDEPVVQYAFEDLELPRPIAHPLRAPDDVDEQDGVEHILEFHRSAIESGRAEAVLTCLAEVHETLRGEGIPVWRIEHTVATVEEALQKARLSDQLIRSRSEQLAVALFEADRAALAALDVYEREETRLRVHRELLELARRNGGRLTALAGGAFSIAMSRLTLDGDQDGLPDQIRFSDSLDVGIPVRLGIGVGSTFERAEHQAREALEIAYQSGRAHVLFPDGRSYSVPAAEESRAQGER